MTRRLSDWSKPGEPPPMVGVWETKLAHETEGCGTYQHWNGEFYGFCSLTPGIARGMRECLTGIPPEHICFRGLADKPE